MTDRGISSEIRRSQTFGSLGYRERDLFQGLIERMVDDQGRAPADPALVRSEVWPYDDISLAEVEGSLQILAGGEDPFILIYTVYRKKYLQIINWWKWQRANMFYAHRSIHPAPEHWTDRVHINTKGNKLDEENWDMEGGFSSSHISPEISGEWIQAVQAAAGVKVGTQVPSQVPTQVGTLVPSQVPPKVDIDINTDTNTDKTVFDNQGFDISRARDKNSPSDRAKNAWNMALGDLERDMSRADFESYVRPLVFSGFDGRTVKILAGNRYQVDFIKKRMVCKILEDHVRASMNDPGVTIQITVSGAVCVPAG